MKAQQITLSKNLDREGVIRALLPVVRRHVARLSRGPHARVRDDDLLSAGLQGLFEATKQFDPERVDSFVGYASVRIRGAMIDELRKADDLSQELRTRSRELESAVQRLQHQLGRQPTEEEIAAALRISLADYTALLETVSTIKVVQVDAEDPVLRDATDDEGSNPEMQAERRQLRARLASAITLLPHKEQQVMALHYDHDLSFREIGEVLDLTAARICQLHAQAVHRMRAYLGEHTEGAGDE